MSPCALVCQVLQLPFLVCACGGQSESFVSPYFLLEQHMLHDADTPGGFLLGSGGDLHMHPHLNAHLSLHLVGMQCMVQSHTHTQLEQGVGCVARSGSSGNAKQEWRCGSDLYISMLVGSYARDWTET